MEESEGESAEKAAELITRMDAVVKEQKLLSGSEKQFGIYQITARDPEHDYRFMNLDFVKRHGMEVNCADYELVYTEPLTEKIHLKLFTNASISSVQRILPDIRFPSVMLWC